VIIDKKIVIIIFLLLSVKLIINPPGRDHVTDLKALGFVQTQA